MKKNLTLIFKMIIVITQFSFGQENLNTDNYFGKIPQEKVFVHLNTTLLITGENMYYKIYCIDTDTGKLSNISKIAYIELVNPEGKPIFKHKIRLRHGVGQGDFSLPNSLFSGNYKLIAYTQWMGNNEKFTYFQNDISIINPKLEGQPLYKNGGVISIDSVENKSEISIDKDYIPNTIKSQYINLELDKNQYINRDEVTLLIKTLKGIASFGNYSISIRKKDAIPTLPTHYTTNFSTSSFKHSNNDPIYLPEMRGELIQGKIKYKDTGKPAENIKVALSIPGINFIFKIANTNSSGIFYFNLMKEYESTNATIQVIETKSDLYEVELYSQNTFNYSELTFNDLQIPLHKKSLLLERSINTQIENAYKSIKRDSLSQSKPKAFFYESDQVMDYNLDDYTRFRTMREVVVEILKDVWISQNKEGSRFNVRLAHTNTTSNYPPLVLVDGVFISDHKDLLNLDARKIKRIIVMRNNYLYGSAIFQGVLAVQTFDGNYGSNATGDFVINFQLFKPQTDKIYYRQEYNRKNTFNRVPDYRTQLLWEPNFTLSNSVNKIRFFTSDISGEYEIMLEGFTFEGRPISINKTFIVNQSRN